MSEQVDVRSDEIQRYIERCKELSNGGEYSWWSRLAEILGDLSETAAEMPPLKAHIERLGRERDAWFRATKDALETGSIVADPDLYVSDRNPAPAVPSGWDLVKGLENGSLTLDENLRPVPATKQTDVRSDGALALPDDDEPKTFRELAQAAIMDLRRYADDEWPHRRHTSADAYEERFSLLSAILPAAPRTADEIYAALEAIKSPASPEGREAETERIQRDMERILREQSERDIPFAPVPGDEPFTELPDGSYERGSAVPMEYAYVDGPQGRVRIPLGLAQPAEPKGRERCRCDQCSSIIELDVHVPDETWKRISPKPVEGFKGGGLLCAQCIVDALLTVEPMGKPQTVTYTNWRGEVAERRILPLRLWYGSTGWHRKPQWLITARDLDKGVERDFALSGFGWA